MDTQPDTSQWTPPTEDETALWQQHRAHFDQEHANQPVEDWQPADYDTYENFHLTA